MSDRKEMWCPFMNCMCVDGWTEKMKIGAFKKGPDPRCRFWIKLSGKHPQEDKYIDEYDCAVAWLPTLMVEQCRIENSTGAAVESMRNRTADVAGALTQMTSVINSKPVVMLNGPAAVDTTTESPAIEHKEEMK
jgi:hypothetical protein